MRARAALLGMLVATRLLFGGCARAPRRPQVVRIEIDQAPSWRLALIPGIGPARALRMTQLRRSQRLCGPADLTRIRGIGRRQAIRIGRTREVRITWEKPDRYDPPGER